MVRQKAEVQTQRFKAGLTAGAPFLTEAGGSQSVTSSEAGSAEG